MTYAVFSTNGFDDMEAVHIKIRTLVVKGLDLFLAVFIMLLSFFDVINAGVDFVSGFEFFSTALFLTFVFVVNVRNYSKLSVVNVFLALSVFLVLGIVKPADDSVMILSTVFFLFATFVFRRFYSVVSGVAFAAVMLFLYFRKIGGDDYYTALPFMLGYILLSFLLMLVAMLFKYFVRDSANTFAAEKEKMGEESRKKDALIKKYSHDIRTSLSNIIGIVSVLTKDAPEPRKKLLDTVTASVKNIVGVIELVDIQAGETGDIADESSGEKEVFDLEELIMTCAEFTFGVSVKIRTEEPLPLFNADTVALRRLFMCVFDFFKRRSFGKNSVSLSLVIGRVKIPPVPVKYRFDVSVADSLQIFDDGMPGYTGLIERLVKSLGGAVKYDFGEDKSLLYFNFRLDEAGDMAVSQRKTHAYGGYNLAYKVKKLSQASVLICEDNPINQKVMTLSLEKYVGGIDVAFNGRECLRLFQQKQYDVILMDIQMPVLDGYETTKAIRKIEKSGGEIRHVPIIAVTANSLSGDRENCINAGMDDYFSKPFHIEKVIARISEFLIKYPQE